MAALDHEENVSAKPPGSQAPSRFSRPDGHAQRPQGAGPPQSQGAQAPFGVTGPGRMTGRLKKRRDFLAAAKGSKVPRRAFVLEARRREDDEPARIGFTVSKRVSKKAVERNRIRRRFKEAARLVAAEHAVKGHDYVLVGRRAALAESFGQMAADLAGALAQATRRAGRPSRLPAE